MWRWPEPGGSRTRVRRRGRNVVADILIPHEVVAGQLRTDARRIVDTARSRVNDIRRKTAALKKPKALVELGARPFFVATKEFFVNDYLEFAGAVNIFRDSPTGSVGREEAVMRDPDVILIVTMGLSGQNERQAWKRYALVNAVKNGRVFVIDSDDVCSPTPLSFVRSLETIAGLLHPELKGAS